MYIYIYKYHKQHDRQWLSDKRIFIPQHEYVQSTTTTHNCLHCRQEKNSFVTIKYENRCCCACDGRLNNSKSLFCLQTHQHQCSHYE